MLIRPSPIVTGTISLNVRFTAGSWMSITMWSRPSSPRSHGSGKQELRDRRDEDRDRVDVEPLRVASSSCCTPRPSPRRMIRFHSDRAQRGHGEVVVAVEDPDHDPGQPEDEHEREEDAREFGRERRRTLSRSVAEDLHHPRRDDDEKRRQPAQPEEHQPEDRRGDPPRALALSLHEQVAEDGDERRRQRRVGDERAHRVRDEERDLESVDRAGDAEDGGLGDLPHQTDDAREPRSRSRRSRPSARARGRLASSLPGGADGAGAAATARRLPLRVERLRLELDQLTTIAARPEDRRRIARPDPARRARTRASRRSRSTSACPARVGGGRAPAAARAAAARRPPRGQHRERGCYHRPAREPRVFFRRCRTSSNKRSASARRHGSGRRTSAGARPRRR